MISHILLLALSTSIWGFGFVAAKMTFESYDPYWSHAFRFIIAGLLGLPYLVYKKSFNKNFKILKQALFASIYLTGTLLFQTLGLKYTSVAKSGFITTLYVLFVPITMMAIYKKKYGNAFWILVLTSIFGMALLCDLKFENLNYGDLLVLICSFFASFHIIYIGIVAHEVKSPIEFNFIQNIFVGIFGAVIAFIMSGKSTIDPLLNIQSDTFKGMIFLSVISSMIAFSIQVIAQKKIPTHIASLVFLLESPFAAIFGYLVFNEKLSWMSTMGAVVILISVALVPVLGREVTASLKIKKGDRT